MTMDKLIEILKDFDIERTKKCDEGVWNEDAVAKCFRPCAEKILCNGYFLVNDEYIIDLGAIELYYHEEEGDIKDYIMYHINDNKKNKSKIRDNDGRLPYFKFGSFNLHQSGVDVTFENEEKKYRASFLIRSYRLLRKGEERKLNDLTIPFDKCSTHIFDDMFYSGISFDKMHPEIKWAYYKKDDDIEKDGCSRVNVAVHYWDNESNEIKKKQVMITENEYQNNRKLYIKAKADVFYEKDLRPWQFKKVGIIEK